MNKHEFMTTLNKALAGIATQDRDEIIFDYEEHFRIGLSDGKTEEEIAASLGDPRAIARQFNADYHVHQAETDASVSNIFRAVLATLGLGFFNLVIVLGPFIAMLAVLFAFYVAGSAIIFSGVVVFITTVAGPILPVTNASLVQPAAQFFASIGLICLGLLFIIGNVYLTKFFFIGTVKYLQFNLKIIKGVS
ncbi:HAAS signaling domain-containing protein [Dethiobacter alkaliphilus]|uniref:DUF1700 domain-containing protein n=1 Tax=Dethiobacter alkaliphilus AHT 1 TaxID=555088 RepID=C0GCQ3_DETAL|nr:DUF1700 domain-containing protein [Dethiobacter alkaliphilus]EEG78988.1 protein of unknown function DUF1700 [Dethiobacter alkaliphilus AHT 1]